VVRHHEDAKKEAVRRLQEDKNHIRRVAKAISADVLTFWEQVAQLIKFKHNAVVEAKKREVLNKCANSKRRFTL
jgi:hypothetical protein